MKFYYTDTVLADVEKFLQDYSGDDLPIKAYATAKGFNNELFTNFLAIVEASVLNKNTRSNMEFASGWNRALTYFELSTDQVNQFASILEYYDELEGDFEQNDTEKKNDATEFDKRWATKGYNYPYEAGLNRIPGEYRDFYMYSWNGENANKELIKSNEHALVGNRKLDFSLRPTDEDAPKRYPSHYPYYHTPNKRHPNANNTLGDMAGDRNGHSMGGK